MSTMKSALFCLSLLLLPTAASAQSLTCHLLPSLCQQAPAPSTNAVPELDTNAAGTAGALILGAALLMSSRRRRAA